MTAQAIRRVEVWVASRSPLGYYHMPTKPRTPCNIPTRGYGYFVDIAMALDDACRPCPQCFPAVLARPRRRQ